MRLGQPPTRRVPLTAVQLRLLLEWADELAAEPCVLEPEDRPLVVLLIQELARLLTIGADWVPSLNQWLDAFPVKTTERMPHE